MNVDLTGTTFKYLTADERQAVYLDLAELEGFRQCTRLDAQRTLIEPQADAEQVFEEVRYRRAWVASYSAYGQLGQMDSKGDAVKGSSVCWGAPSSATRSLTYNKAIEDGWEGVRAVRHEVRNRKQPARDRFTAFMSLVRSAPDSDPAAVEARFVQSVLANSMTYLDTTRLSKIRDKREWPENWAKDSQPTPWWKEVVEGVPIELKTRWRITKALEDSMASKWHQYGRKTGLWLMWQVYGLGIPLQEALGPDVDQAVVRLKDEDLEELLKLIPEANHELVRQEWPKWRSAAAHNVEGGARQTYG